MAKVHNSVPVLLNPVITVNSGQMFLWEKHEKSWYGVYNDHILKFSYKNTNSENNISYHFRFDSSPKFDHWEHFVFRLDDDIHHVSHQFARDKLVSYLFRKYRGLRLMRQDPYQCMITFACSSNTNIAMIRRMLRNLSRKFGLEIEMDGRKFFTFPTLKNLSNASINEICSCGIGYRARTIKSIVEKIIRGSLNIESLTQSKYDEAKEKLLNVYGIGNKIADCILLFSLEKTEAFPIDIWVARSIYHYYRTLIDEQNLKLNLKSAKLGINQYVVLSSLMRRYFGKYAGYAQQYLYYLMRQEAKKEW
jgi:N-glycosylase/DNA lyase